MPRLLFGRNQSHAAPAPRFGLKLKCYPSRAHVCRRALGYARLHRAKQAQGWLSGSPAHCTGDMGDGTAIGGYWRNANVYRCGRSGASGKPDSTRLGRV